MYNLDVWNHLDIGVCLLMGEPDSSRVVSAVIPSGECMSFQGIKKQPLRLRRDKDKAKWVDEIHGVSVRWRKV